LLGWLAWGSAMSIPTDRGYLSKVYRSTLLVLQRHDLAARLKDPLFCLMVGGLVLATVLLAISPLLVALNHSSNRHLARCRHLGWLLLLIVPPVVSLVRANGISQWQYHFLGFSHILVCLAILPWPRGLEHAASNPPLEPGAAVPPDPVAKAEPGSQDSPQASA